MWKEDALKTVYHFLSRKYHIDFKIIEDVIPKFRCKKYEGVHRRLIDAADYTINPEVQTF